MNVNIEIVVKTEEDNCIKDRIGELSSNLMLVLEKLKTIDHVSNTLVSILKNLNKLEKKIDKIDYKEITIEKKIDIDNAVKLFLVNVTNLQKYINETNKIQECVLTYINHTREDKDDQKRSDVSRHATGSDSKMLALACCSVILYCLYNIMF